MKRWMTLSLVLAALLVGSLTSQAQEGRKVIYLFNPDFPPAEGVRHPLPPDQETRFWQLLDKEMKATSSLALTENVEKADYRVETECAGIFYCTRLNVSIQTPQRDVLGSFVLDKVKPLSPFKKINLDDVAHRFVQRLDERMSLLEQGGYGYMK